MTSKAENQEQDQNLSMNIEDATKLVVPENVNVNYIFLNNINNILKVVAERGAFKVEEFYDIGTVYKELNSYLETRVEVKVEPSNSLENTQENNNEVVNGESNNESNNLENYQYQDEEDIKIAL